MKKLYTNRSYLRVSLFLLFFSLLSNSITAESFFDAGESSLSLIAESDEISTGETILVGLKFKLNPGWHTYWENPGDAGAGASVVWELPPGFKASEILWPGPTKIPVEPLMTYGYEDEALLLTKITSPRTISYPVNIGAKVSWFTCKEVCLPQEGEVSIKLYQGLKSENQSTSLLREMERTVPTDLSSPHRVSILDNKIFLQFEREEAQQISSAYFFPAEYGFISYVANQKLERNDRSFSLELTPAEVQVKTLNLKGVLKLNSDGDSEYYNLDLPLGDKADQSPLGLNLITALLFAFLGGLILNAMPCVFPILSIKILGFIEQSQGSREKMMQHGFVFSAGVLTTFLIVAGLLLFLRSTGDSIGWGYQMQSPLIISLLIYLFVAVGIVFMGNLVLGGQLAKFGVLAQGQRDLAGSFLTGALAVVVASPCTAPFMGPALGMAFLQPGLGSLFIFLALGIGFSLPYLTLSIFPQLLSKLPKPGEWMETLKQIMAFPMWGSALWLTWVLSSQVELQSVFAVLIGALLVAAGLWLLEKTQNSQGLSRSFALFISVILLAFSLWLIPTSYKASPAEIEGNEYAFSAERLENLRLNQRAVFLNFTADWCITCKVNEAIALNRESVKKILADKNIVYLKADWTRKDPEIALMLARYGRTGVPLYLLFPSQGEPIILPELLTEDMLVGFITEIN